MKSSNARVVGLSLAVALSAACGGMSIDTERDPDVDLTAARTFEWMDRDPPEVSRRATREHLDERIKAAVERELAPRGLVPAEDGQGDLVLAYYVGLDGEFDVMLVNTVPDDRFGVGQGWNYSTGRSDRLLEQGTLVLDMYSAETGQLAWRGIAEAQIDRTDPPEKRAALVDEAVRKLISGYPGEP